MSIEPEPVAAAEPAPAEPAGTPPEDNRTPEELRAALAETTQKFDTLLAEKSNSERRNEELAALRDEIAELRGGYPTPPTPPGANPRLDTFNRGIGMWQEAAAKGDPSAVAFLEVVQMVNGLPSEFNTRIALTEIPGERRKEVERIIGEHAQRGERITPATAARLYDASQLSAREQSLAQREAAVKRFETDRANGVITTHRTPAAPAPAGNGTMTFSEYGRAMDSAKTDAERDKLRSDRKSGALKLSPG